ncbi:hypothetical protein LZZ90_07780 [Flavobacterium sp. SM15]|uniref:hypothetical protein n=1 Tax=Flavobacterium sp. SM15 TaxID=2908005 RepID=UPI001EDA9C2E|nr:hypothetical protein [Flavobacterium sp. SM15]MCG2611403.1 hypothetical protein [Flavobacterium sp. SM15]
MQIKKHTVLLGMTVSLSLVFIATLVYPGGSLFDKNSIGFDWTKNFISNLFAEKAINGLENPSRIWADVGVFLFSMSLALFFIGFSKRIPDKHAAKVVKYLGAGGTFFTFLIVTPLHDQMIVVSGTMFLVSIFYITVFVLKSKLHFFKFLCITSLLIFYYTMYLYGSGDFELLAIMQKVTFVSKIILILSLEYFTTKEDFEFIKTAKLPND